MISIRRTGSIPGPARPTGSAKAKTMPSSSSSSMASRRSPKRSDTPLALAAPANGASAAAAAAAAAPAAAVAASPAVAAPGTASVVLRPAPSAVLSHRAAATVEEELSAAAATFTFDPDTSRDGWHSDGSFRVAMSPRPHEIDEFGVVNNTYYNTFMYAARYRYMTELGVPINAWQSRGVNSVTVKVSTTFRMPLRLSDKFYATSAVRGVSRSQVVLAEAVKRTSDDAVVALSEVVCATVDDDFKVVRIPAEVKVDLERGAAWFAAGSSFSK